MSQPLEALALANEIRRARGALKRDVRNGTASVEAILTDPPECVVTMPIYELLMAQHRWGHMTAMHVLRGCGLSESKRIGEATMRQRLLIIDRL